MGITKTITNDNWAELRTLREWHEQRAKTYEKKSRDHRCSRHTTVSHRKIADFHARAARIIGDVLKVEA